MKWGSFEIGPESQGCPEGEDEVAQGSEWHTVSVESMVGGLSIPYPGVAL